MVQRSEKEPEQDFRGNCSMGKKKQRVRWSLLDGLKWNTGSQREETSAIVEGSMDEVVEVEDAVIADDGQQQQPGYGQHQQQLANRRHNNGVAYPNWRENLAPRFEKRQQYQHPYGRQPVYYEGEYCDTEELPNGFTKIRSKNLDILFKREYYEQRIAQRGKDKKVQQSAAGSQEQQPRSELSAEQSTIESQAGVNGEDGVKVDDDDGKEAGDQEASQQNQDSSLQQQEEARTRIKSVKSFDQIDPNDIPEFKPMNSYVDMSGLDSSGNSGTSSICATNGGPLGNSDDEGGVPHDGYFHPGSTAEMAATNGGDVTVVTTTSAGVATGGSNDYGSVTAAANYSSAAPPRPNLFLYSPANNTLIPCEEIIIPNPVMSAEGPVYGGPTNIYLAYPVTGPDGRGYITQPFSPPPLTVASATSATLSPSDYGGSISCLSSTSASSGSSPHYAGGSGVSGYEGAASSSFSPSSSVVEDGGSQCQTASSTPHTPNSGHDSGSSTQPTSPPPLLNNYHPATWIQPDPVPASTPPSYHRKGGPHRFNNNARSYVPHYQPQQYNGYNNYYSLPPQHQYHSYHAYNSLPEKPAARPMVYGGEVKPLLDPEELEMTAAAMNKFRDQRRASSDAAAAASGSSAATSSSNNRKGNGEAAAANNNNDDKQKASENGVAEEQTEAKPTIQYIPGLPLESIKQAAKKNQKKRRKKKPQQQTPAESLSKSSSYASESNGTPDDEFLEDGNKSHLSNGNQNKHRGSLSSETDEGSNFTPESRDSMADICFGVDSRESAEDNGDQHVAIDQEEASESDLKLTDGLSASEYFYSPSVVPDESPLQEVHLTDDLADFMVNPPTDPECSDEDEKTPTASVAEKLPSGGEPADCEELVLVTNVCSSDAQAQQSSNGGLESTAAAAAKSPTDAENFDAAAHLSRDSTLTDLKSVAVEADDLTDAAESLEELNQAKDMESQEDLGSTTDPLTFTSEPDTQQAEGHQVPTSLSSDSNDSLKDSSQVQDANSREEEQIKEPQSTSTHDNLEKSAENKKELEVDAHVIVVDKINQPEVTTQSPPKKGARKGKSKQDNKTKSSVNKTDSQPSEASSTQSATDTVVESRDKEPSSKSSETIQQSIVTPSKPLTTSETVPQPPTPLSLSYSAVCKSSSASMTQSPASESPAHSSSGKVAAAAKASADKAKHGQQSSSQKSDLDKSRSSAPAASGSPKKSKPGAAAADANRKAANDVAQQEHQDGWETVPPALVAGPEKWEKKKDRKRKNRQSQARNLSPSSTDSHADSSTKEAKTEPLRRTGDRESEDRQSKVQESQDTKAKMPEEDKMTPSNPKATSQSEEAASPKSDNDLAAGDEKAAPMRPRKPKRNKKKHLSGGDGAENGELNANGLPGAGGSAGANAHKVLIRDNQIEIRYSRSIRRASDVLNGNQLDTIRSTGFCDYLFVEKLGSGIARGSIGLGRLYQGKYVPPERLDGLVADRIKQHEEEEAAAAAAADAANNDDAQQAMEEGDAQQPDGGKLATLVELREEGTEEEPVTTTVAASPAAQANGDLDLD